MTKKQKRKKVDNNEECLFLSKAESYNGLSRLVLKEQEDTYYEFEIVYDLMDITINPFLSKKNNLLVLTDIDIEGPGARELGQRIFSFKKDVSLELCRRYNCQCVELHGARRTTGKMNEKIPMPEIICL